jgi:hypothetical protein
MPIETDADGRDDNEGPHCRNCHIGANNCDVCHADDTQANFSAAYSAVESTITSTTMNKTSYVPQSYLKQSAVAGLNGKCIDGGFSFPHRTLGANMLKDELYGIDFDGTVVAFGGSRGLNGGAAPDGSGKFSIDSAAAGTDFVLWTGSNNASSAIPAVASDTSGLEGAAVENLDSVCIDCHGDASYWKGDAEAAPYWTAGVDTPYTGVYGSGQRGGWELLLKGLP